MARIDKRTRNRRLTGLAVVLVVLVLLVVLAIRWSCAPDGNGTGSGDSPSETGDITVRVGEPAVRGEVEIAVTVFVPTTSPSLPLSAASDDSKPQLGSGDTFYQAFVWVENPSDSPVRLDPADFALLVDGGEFPVDLTRSGPSARTLLQGASFQLILTFIGPADDAPRLRYRSSWSQGTIIFEGVKKPAGMAGVRPAGPVAASGWWPAGVVLRRVLLRPAFQGTDS